MITSNEKKHVIVHSDDKINVMIQKMITLNEKEYIVINPDGTINFTL